MELIIKLDTYFKKLESGKLVLTLCLLSYIVTSPIIALQMILNERPLWKLYDTRDINLGALFVVVIFITPFIETFIYQTVVFGILKKISFFQKRKC